MVVFIINYLYWLLVSWLSSYVLHNLTVTGNRFRKADISPPAEVRLITTADPPEYPALDTVGQTLLGLLAPGVARHQAGGGGETPTSTQREHGDTLTTTTNTNTFQIEYYKVLCNDKVGHFN